MIEMIVGRTGLGHCLVGGWHSELAGGRYWSVMELGLAGRRQRGEVMGLESLSVGVQGVGSSVSGGYHLVGSIAGF